MPDVEALILDLDGVIRHWNRDGFVDMATSFGVSADDFAAIAFEPDLLAAAMTGALDADEWGSEIGRRVNELHGPDAVAVADAFAALGWTIDFDVVALVRRVRDGGRAKVALFSNASTRLEDDLRASGVYDAFDVVFNSARLRMAKPDPDAFRAVAASLGTTPERCLFVDDTLPNIDGARAAGMWAEHFDGIAGLRSLLEPAGLL